MYEIEFDPLKRKLALQVHKADFKDAVQVFDGRTFNRRDDRKDYGEPRFVTFGVLHGRMVVVVWTPRGVRSAHHLDEEGQ